MDDSDVSPAPIVIDAGLEFAWFANVGGGPAAQVPSWIVSVPELSVAPDEANVPDVTVWPCAICWTDTE